MPLDEVMRRTRASNPKQHDIPALLDSIYEHGFDDPPTIDERDGLLVEGHGRIEALIEARKQGRDAPKGVGVQRGSGAWFVPILRGVRFASDTEAESYLLRHNKLTERGGWKMTETAGLLQRLAEQGVVVQRLGWTDAELREMFTTRRALGAGASKPQSWFAETGDDPAPGRRTLLTAMFAVGDERVIEEAIERAIASGKAPTRGDALRVIAAAYLAGTTQ